MTNEAVRRDLTDEALEALHQTALDAVRNRAGHVNELLAADAASSAIERLVKEVEDGHVIRDREAHVKKAAQDWVDASLNLTAEDLEDLHQAALRGARSVGSRLALLVAEDAANTAMSKVVARIYDGVEIKNPLAYVRAAARNCTITYIKAANKLPPVDFDDIPHGAGVLRRASDLADMDPGDVVVETEMLKLRELVFRCTLGLLDTRDADILKALRSDEQLSVAQLAARFDFDPDAFTRHRYLIERVSPYAYDSLMHPKLMPETRKHFANCLEGRVDEPDSGIETRIGQALEWLRSHFSDKPTAYPETTHSMLSAAWRINRPGPGRPSIDAKARRRLLAAAADYVLLEGDARPDEEQDGFRDDYEVVRSARRALGMDAAGAGDTYYTLSGE